MIKKLIFFLAFTATLTSCAPQGYFGNPKNGVAASAQDTQDCSFEVDKAVAAIVDDMRRGAAEWKLMNSCMQSKGYQYLPYSK